MENQVRQIENFKWRPVSFFLKSNCLSPIADSYFDPWNPRNFNNSMQLYHRNVTSWKKIGVKIILKSLFPSPRTACQDRRRLAFFDLHLKLIMKIENDKNSFPSDHFWRFMSPKKSHECEMPVKYDIQLPAVVVRTSLNIFTWFK